MSKIISNFVENLVIMEVVRNNSGSLIELMTCEDRVQAEMIFSILEENGIFCVMHDEYMAAIYTPVAFPIRLMIREEDLERAKALLE